MQRSNPVLDAGGKAPYHRPDLDATTQPLSQLGRKFLNDRKISNAIIDANDVRSATAAFPEKGGKWVKRECIVFPYYKDDEIVNAKYRSLEGAAPFLTRGVL